MRVSILSIFVSLFVIIIFSMLSISYFRFYSTISTVAIALMNKTSSIVLREINDEIERTELLSRFSSYLITEGVVNTTERQSDIIDYTFHLVRADISYVQSAFWADESGDFFSSEEEQYNGAVTKDIIDRVSIPQKETLIFYDSKGQSKEKKTIYNIQYDPRVRPWYLAATKAKKTVWTDIYRYHNTNFLGVSVATPVYYPNGRLRGVFGLHIQLNYLRNFIENVKVSQHGIVYIVNTRGDVIVYPHVAQYDRLQLMNIKNIDNKPIVESFDEYKKMGKSSFKFRVDDNDYFATFSSVPGFSTYSWLIGVVVPESDFVGELHKTNIIVSIVGLTLLMIGICFMSYLVSRLVKPLKKLTSEVERIKGFHLEETPHIQSRIKEIISISDAVYAMKQGLRSFKKYVPAALVRKLVKTGEDVRIGGVKKEIAIFFSDIKNFTTISEYIDPVPLTQHLCEYFTELAKIINAYRGTIDKYIGDSMMAFWGAPIQEKHPGVQAAKAALSCQKRLIELNAKWQSEGKPVFYTRMGVHIGDAIVGNVGSPERLNYTVIGDVINIASRLEGLNKIYDTQIIVSDTIYQKIERQFVLRMIDCVAPYGVKVGHRIYELVAENRNEVTYDIDQYTLLFAKAFAEYQQANWDKAIKLFFACKQIYSEDTITPIFIKRCQNFMTNSPPSGWDGVWYFGVK